MLAAVTREDLVERARAILDGTGTLPEKLTQVASATAEAFEAERAWVAVDRDGQLWTVGGVSMVLADPRHGPLPAGAGIIGRAVRTGKTQRVDDVQADPDYVAAVALIRSELAVPILDPTSGAIGVLNVEANRLRAFGPAEGAIGERVAAVIAPHLLRLRNE
jgi:GAF domain-containing protein